MNLNSDIETLKEIDDIINNTSFKFKLSKKEPLDPDDILNDSLTDMSQMPSLYLTEPSMPTRNYRLPDHTSLRQNPISNLLVHP
jgi:hypothetical protein